MPPDQDYFDRNHGFPPPTPYRRSVHAPQRVIKVFKSQSPCTKSQFEGNLAVEMGNFMGLDRWSRLHKAKAEALGIFRSRKDETIDVDLKGPSYVISEGSSADGNIGLIGDRNCYCFKPLIDYESKLAESKFLALNFISRGQKKNLEEDVLHGPFPPLTDEEEDLIFHALYHSDWEEVLTLHKSSNIEITSGILQCLKPDEWLNDEVINLYLELLKEREQRDPEKFLKCHYFNTFFFKKLISGRDGYDFKAVRRWTKRIPYSLMDCDKTFVPIHKEIHWCLSVINIKERKFQFVDSLHHGGAQVPNGREVEILNVLVRYIMDEVEDKSEKDVDANSWELEYVVDRPVQRNGSDCGMFMIKYIDFYSRGSRLCFTQEHMPYFRKRTAKEILKLKAD